MIIIDGSYGEGGGQLIRTSLSLSAITGRPVQIDNIRAKRTKPGLQMQHLTAVKAVRKVCRGTLEGAELESKKLVFHPGEIVGGNYEFNIGTAGSVTLVAQTIIPILLYAKKKSDITIIGGTHVIRSPSYDYFEHVFLPAIRMMGIETTCEMIKPGYYPKGGGEIRITINPSKIKGNTTWPKYEQIKGIIRVANLPISIAIREKKILLNNKIQDIKVREEQALSPGNAVTLWKQFKGSYVPGERGKRAEEVAQEAIDGLSKETEDVDKHLADQLLLYGALADEETSYKTSEITQHFKTNADIIQRFVDKKIECDEKTVKIN